MSTIRVLFACRAAGVVWMVGTVCTAWLAAGGARPAAADDRDLIRAGQRDPYVFVLLDVSGSMHQSVQCTAADNAQGLCAPVCATGACLPRMMADDPASRMFVAKESIYEIMRRTDGVNFGFATFDQRNLRVLYKHWWYRVDAAPAAGLVQLDSGRRYPALGHEEIFGEAAWKCTDGMHDNGNHDATLRWIGCPLPGQAINGQPNQPVPADLDDAWEFERVRRYPKLGIDNNDAQTYFIRDNADNPATAQVEGPRTYRVTYTPVAGQTLGNPQVRARVLVERCTNANCGSGNRVSLGERDITFTRASEMVYWEPGEGVRKQPDANGGVAFYGSAPGVRNAVGGGRTRWESNDDSNEDASNGVNVRHDNVADPHGRGLAFRVGDVIPMDWRDSQRQTIMQRMAPNLTQPGNPAPNFQIASYFEDRRTTGNPILRLRSSQMRPLVPDGGTPIGGSMQSFIDWMRNEWGPAASNDVTGDPNFDCRQTYLLLITDGLASASDSPSACDVAEDLRTELSIGGRPYSVRSFVVALGVQSSIPNFNNRLGCVADKGGTGTGDVDSNGKPDGPGVLLPQNKDQLIRALTDILEVVKSESRSFAAAAVPSVQADAEDKVVLSSFVPVKQPIWPGHVDAYIKPIPLTEITLTHPDGSTEQRLVPDRKRLCSDEDDVECLIWDGAAELLQQAPTPEQAADGDFKLGLGEEQRRVYWSRDDGAVPHERLSFAPPAGSDTLRWRHLLTGMEICPQADALCPLAATARNEAVDAFELFYRIKQYEDPESTGSFLPYVLGDIFHSDPVVVGEPANFRYFASNLNGYRAFFNKHRNRRKVLLVGSNDGALHAFDAGIFRETEEAFDPGTGRELFAFVPRPVLPSLHQAAEDAAVDGDGDGQPDGHGGHAYKVDGTAAIADVHIDPTPPATGAPTREWRTVAIGGLREGGRGYYALDLTQPDTMADGVPEPRSGASEYVPSCTDSPLDDGDCGPVPYPTVLWEHLDLCGGSPCDDDGNALPDLGETWSIPNIGRIRVCNGDTCDAADPDNDLEDRYVAVFGGGMDPTKLDQQGNFLYMVDVETGQVIYKRQVDGSVPSEPAAVDTDFDGYLDTVYVGTTRGFMYKVDLRTPGRLEALPGIGTRVEATAWRPIKIFDTGGRPIYYPPAVIFVTARTRYALAFGTGDRKDLWAPTSATGRFYLFLDDALTPATTGLPFDADDLTRIGVGDAPRGGDLLLGGQQPAGWYIDLAAGERIVTKAFALSGVTIFSSFQPQTIFGGAGSSTVCGSGGKSRIWVVKTTNADPIFESRERFRVVDDFVTSPFTEPGSTKNRGAEDEGEDDSGLSEHLEKVMRELQKLFPRNCKFSNTTINIKAVRSDTGIEFIAPVPVCVVEKNWKEF